MMRCDLFFLIFFESVNLFMVSQKRDFGGAIFCGCPIFNNYIINHFIDQSFQIQQGEQARAVPTNAYVGANLCVRPPFVMKLFLSNLYRHSDKYLDSNLTGF
jgi:hypothetical protein